MKLSRLLLDSGNEIPFIEGTISIHPPTIKELALMGEEEFFSASHLLTFSKEKFLSSEDKANLENTSNFSIFMQLMNDKSTKEIQETRANVTMLLALMFPDYEVHIETDKIVFLAKTNYGFINEFNYEAFKEIVKALFCMAPLQSEEYKPIGKLAQKIADKLAAGRKKAAELKGEKGAINIFQRYVSILSVGLQLDKNVLYNYTVHQLYDEFERYQLKIANDIHIKAMMAGAKQENDPPDWQKDLDDKSNDQS